MPQRRRRGVSDGELPRRGELDEWLTRIRSELEPPGGEPAAAPFCPNLIVHRSNRRLDQDLETLGATASSS